MTESAYNAKQPLKTYKDKSTSTGTKKGMNIVTADRTCDICGALSKPVDSFLYDAEYSYDDYYQTECKPCS